MLLLRRGRWLWNWFGRRNNHKLLLRLCRQRLLLRWWWWWWWCWFRGSVYHDLLHGLLHDLLRLLGRFGDGSDHDRLLLLLLDWFSDRSSDKLTLLKRFRDGTRQDLLLLLLLQWSGLRHDLVLHDLFDNRGGGHNLWLLEWFW